MSKVKTLGKENAVTNAEKPAKPALMRENRQFLLAGAAVMLVLLAIYVLPPPALLEPNVEAGWSAALGELFLRHAQVGIDLVFTYGPWGFLSQPCGNPAIYPWLVFGRLVLALGTALGAAYLTFARVRQPLWRGLWLAAFAMLANPSMAAPLLLYAVLVESKRAPLRPWCLAALAPACALSAHVKLMTLPLVAALTVIVAIHEIFRERRTPWVAASVPLYYALFYFLAEQRAASFLPYLRGAYHILTSYSSGMALEGGASGVVMGALLCAGVLAGYAIAIWREPDRRNILGWLWVAAYFFMSFKQAFVRDEGLHVWMGMVTLALPASMVVALLWHGDLRPAWEMSLDSWIAATAVFFVLSMPSADVQYSVRQKWGPFLDLPTALQGSAVRLQAYDDNLALLREEFPLPRLAGTVDVVPWDIFAVLANRLDYRPRPVLQSYQALDSYLAQLNADYLTGPHAPDFVLVNFQSLDGRYPSLDDNLARVALATHYEPAGPSGHYAVLHKSARPAATRFEPIKEWNVGWDEAIEMPPGGTEPLWLQVDVATKPLGHLTDFLLRLPKVEMQIQVGSDSQAYRTVLSLARVGFPLLNSGATRMSMATSSLGRWCYGPKIGVRLSRLVISAGQQ